MISAQEILATFDENIQCLKFEKLESSIFQQISAF